MKPYEEKPSILSPFEMFEKLSPEEQTRLREEMEEKALKNEVSMLAAARRQGEQVGIKKYIEYIEYLEMIGIEIAKKQTVFNMLTEGMDVKLISRITGLSEDEIKKLQETGASRKA